jgi:hypothetical protein
MLTHRGQSKVRIYSSSDIYFGYAQNPYMRVSIDGLRVKEMYDLYRWIEEKGIDE